MPSPAATACGSNSSIPAPTPRPSSRASDFGIQPVPFQTADRYQSSIVNSYFNLLVPYGDQYQTLGFRDLIEVKDNGANAPRRGAEEP